MPQSSKENLILENPIVKQALNGEKIDTELLSWTGGDILRLSYIRASLKAGKSPEWCADFYGVLLVGVKKYFLSNN